MGADVIKRTYDATNKLFGMYNLPDSHPSKCLVE